jgi:hypothetical protein
MAFVNDAKYLRRHSMHQNFTRVYNSGDIAEWDGIYHCITCGEESAIRGGEPLPDQNDHQHGFGISGPIQWRLIVQADRRQPRP